MNKDEKTEVFETFLNSLPKGHAHVPMYHYTSPDGFLSIINNQKLWFTRYDCLNDYTERKYIMDVLLSVCEKLKHDKRIDDKLYNEIINLELNKKELLFSYPEDKSHLKKAEVEYYVCCFSSDRDSLPMWNYYCNSNKYEGYNLEFSYDLLDFYTYRHRNSSVKLFDVIYDKTEQENRIEHMLTKIIENSSNNMESIINRLLEFLKAYALAFKNPCFKHENETRIIIAIPRDGTDDYPINYRISNGCVVPYIEFEFEKRKMTGVTIGPLVNSAISESTIWRLLKQRGYKFDDIVTSKVPIRF